MEKERDFNSHYKSVLRMNPIGFTPGGCLPPILAIASESGSGFICLSSLQFLAFPSFRRYLVLFLHHYLHIYIYIYNSTCSYVKHRIYYNRWSWLIIFSPMNSSNSQSHLSMPTPPLIHSLLCGQSRGRAFQSWISFCRSTSIGERSDLTRRSTAVWDA